MSMLMHYKDAIHVMVGTLSVKDDFKMAFENIVHECYYYSSLPCRRSVKIK